MITTHKAFRCWKDLRLSEKIYGMYLGDPHDGSALHHCIWEVVDNSVDEHLAGHTNLVEVGLNLDGSLSVRDYGRGIQRSARRIWYICSRGHHDKTTQVANSITVHTRCPAVFTASVSLP